MNYGHTDMRLNKALAAWGSSGFKDILKLEIESHGIDALPLQQGLSLSNYVSPDDLSVMIISCAGHADLIQVKAGVFYSGVIAGCNCADDPTPADKQAEYCVLQLDIDRQTAETRIKLLQE